MQDKPILYMSPGSHHSRRVMLLIREMEIDVDEQIVGVRPPGMGGENEGSEFLAMNPAGKVPVLRDGSLTLSESNAIMIYLAETLGPTQLWPDAPKVRAKISQWQFFQAAHISPTTDGFLYENVVKPMTGQHNDAPALKQLTSSFHRWCRVLSHTLSHSDYLVGNELSCADLSVACAFMYERAAQLPVGEHDAVQSWLRRIRDRESWIATELAAQPM
ncbi:MAG: glutathione S-transferase family protein [Pseudomonadota bacterium]